MTSIYKSNLIIAVSLAIEAKEKEEKENFKYTTDSSLLAGWKENLKALRDGEKIIIRDDN